MVVILVPVVAPRNGVDVLHATPALRDVPLICDQVQYVLAKAGGDAGLVERPSTPVAC